MINRSLLLAMMVMACTGCIGVAFDRTTSETITNPVPLRAPLKADKDFDRWACQPDPQFAEPLTKGDFLAAWGEPQTKEVGAEKETWAYAESGRWCGFWIAFILPVPVMLPVCDTYDRITFENGLAVHATSRRFVMTAIGIVLNPYAAVPVFSRAGNANEDRPSHGKFPGESPGPCLWQRPGDSTALSEESSPEDSLPFIVSCFSDGKRQRVDRSQCDSDKGE